MTRGGVTLTPSNASLAGTRGPRGTWPAPGRARRGAVRAVVRRSRAIRALGRPMAGRPAAPPPHPRALPAGLHGTWGGGGGVGTSCGAPRDMGWGWGGWHFLRGSTGHEVGVGGLAQITCAVQRSVSAQKDGAPPRPSTSKRAGGREGGGAGPQTFVYQKSTSPFVSFRGRGGGVLWLSAGLTRPCSQGSQGPEVPSPKVPVDSSVRYLWQVPVAEPPPPPGGGGGSGPVGHSVGALLLYEALEAGVFPFAC